MNVRSIRYTRSVGLGGGDQVRYSAAADLDPGDQADACAVQLAAQVNGWLHDALAQHYQGDELPSGRPGTHPPGAQQA